MKPGRTAQTPGISRGSVLKRGRTVKGSQTMKHTDAILSESSHPAHPQNLGAPASEPLSLTMAEQLRLIPPIAPLIHVGPDRPFFAVCADTPCGSGTRKGVFMAYAAVAQTNGATWRVSDNGKWINYYARQKRITELSEYGERTVRRETQALLQAGRLRRVQAGRGRLPHAYQVVPEGWGPSTVRPVDVTQKQKKGEARPATVAGLNPVDRPLWPVAKYKRAYKEPVQSRARYRRAVRTTGTGGAPRSKAVAPPSTDPRASGYGCEVCTDTGMCPGDDGRVRRCDCYQTNPIILARQADRRRQ